MEEDGIAMVTVVPLPGSDFMSALKSCKSQILFTIDSPNPGELFHLLSVFLNLSNTTGRSSGEIPLPLSITCTLY